MKSSKSLDAILKNYSGYQDFIESIDVASNWIYSILTDWSEEKINIISHLADADGFGSQIVTHKGIERILDFLGNTFKGVESRRIMSFSDNVGSEQSLEFLKSKMGVGKYIILDLATLNPECANAELSDVLIIDHHKPKEGFDSKFKLVNPHLNGIDGGKELSASMISTFVINRVYELIERDYSDDKAFRPALKKLREDLDYISIFGIAGSKADMQEDTGLNKAMYEYLEDRGLIKKVNCPFYGYSSKEVGRVFAQTSPMYNFMFKVPNKSELNTLISHSFPKLPSNRETLVDRLFTDFRGIFVDEKDKLRINVPYINSLSVKEIANLNIVMEELTGYRVADINHNDGEMEVKICEPYLISKFDNFEDDIKGMDVRVLLAEEMIRGFNFDPKNTLSRQKSLIGILREKIQDSLRFFGDRDDLEWSLAKLDEEQYVTLMDKGLVSKSVSEIANEMTAMSKLECGQLYMDAIDDVLDGQYKSKKAGVRNNISEVMERVREYKEYVYKGMKSLEERMLARNKDELIKCSDRVHYMNVDFLNLAFDGNIDLKKMNGVMGGIASNVKLLPGGKGIFFSGVNFNGIYEGESCDLIKISGRATDSPMYEGVKINKFMEHYGGGGHGAAAACVIPKSKLDEFLESMSKFDFYRGEFDE